MRRWLGYLAVAMLLAAHVHAQQQVTAPRSLSHNHSPCPTGFLLGNSGCELPWRPCGTGCAWDKASALCWPQMVLNSTNTTAAPPPSPPLSTACQRCPMSTGHPCYDASSNTCSTFLPGSTVCRRITDTVCLTDPRPGARLCSSCFPGTYGHCQLDSTWCLLALWDADATPPTLTCASASHACSDSNTGMEALQSVQLALWLPLHTPNASWSMTSFQAQALRSAIANVANVPASFVALTAVEQGDGVHPTAAASLGCHRRLVHSSEGVTMYATIVASLFSAGDGASAHALATALRGDDAASRIETLSGQTGLRVTGVQNLVPYDDGSSSSDDNADDDGSGSGSGSSSDTGDGSGSDAAGSGSGSDDGSGPTDAQGTDAGVEPVRGATTDTSPNGSTMFGLMVLLAGLGGMALLCALCVILMLPRDEDGRRGKGKRRSAVLATRVVSFSDNGHSRNNSSSSSGSHSRASSGGNGSWTGLHLPHSRHPIWRSQRSDGSWSSKPSPSPSSAAAAEAAATAAPAPAPASRANRSHRLAWHDNVNTAAVPHRTTSSGLQRQGGYRQVLQQEERQQRQQQQQGRRRRRRRRQMQGRQQARQQRQVESLRANLPGSSQNVKATAKLPSSSSSSDSESESGSGTSSSSSASPSSDGSKTSNTAVTKAVAVRRGARVSKRQRNNRKRFQAKP